MWADRAAQQRLIALEQVHGGEVITMYAPA
jgi:hypothetical protein